MYLILMFFYYRSFYFFIHLRNSHFLQLYTVLSLVDIIIYLIHNVLYAIFVLNFELYVIQLLVAIKSYIFLKKIIIMLPICDYISMARA